MPIDPADILSRFIYTSRHLRQDNSVKWQAFKPRNNETSVHKTTNLNETDIWAIGRDIEFSSGRELKGRADIITSNVFAIALDVIESPPPPSHANIIGWPQDEADVKQKALELADSSEGHRI